MTRKDKELQKFLENPESVSFKKIEKFLKSLGFEKASIKGSHYKFRHKELRNNLIIPIHKGDCKKYYKKFIAKILIKKIL